MNYRLTIRHRGDAEPFICHCEDLKDVFQTISDALQIEKDHWNITGVEIDWTPPARYVSRETV